MVFSWLLGEDEWGELNGCGFSSCFAAKSNILLVLEFYYWLNLLKNNKNNILFIEVEVRRQTVVRAYVTQVWIDRSAASRFCCGDSDEDHVTLWLGRRAVPPQTNYYLSVFFFLNLFIYYSTMRGKENKNSLMFVFFVR